MTPWPLSEKTTNSYQLRRCPRPLFQRLKKGCSKNVRPWYKTTLTSTFWRKQTVSLFSVFWFPVFWQHRFEVRMTSGLNVSTYWIMHLRTAWSRLEFWEKNTHTHIYICRQINLQRSKHSLLVSIRTIYQLRMADLLQLPAAHVAEQHHRCAHDEAKTRDFKVCK